MIYQIGGKGTRVLMVAYTLIPIIVLILFDFNFKSINVTHSFLSLLFVGFINCAWELFNSWRRHWIYRTDCELFGSKGWILNNKLHYGIFIQYFISGYIVSYFSWIFFN